jgi:hypothetical protein
VIDSEGTVRGDSEDIELEAGRIATWFIFGKFIVGSGYTVDGAKTGFRAGAKVGGTSGSDRVAVPAE